MREIVPVEPGQRDLVLEAAQALAPHGSAIADEWRRLYAAERGDDGKPRQAITDFAAAVELFLLSLRDADFDRFYERIEAAGTTLARTREQYEDLILAFHMYEEATLPALQAAFGGRIVDVIFALDHLYHNVIAILARAYFKELERERELLFGVLAHDIRSPLMAISLSSETLARRADAAAADPDGAGKRLAERITRGTQRVVQLVDQILEYGRLKSGTAVSDRAVVDLVALTKEAAQLFLDDAERERLSVTLNGRTLDDDSAAPVPVAADRDMVVRAVGNFLTNAAKHARSAVEISVEARGDDAVLAVRDDGPGIPAAELPRLFDDYYTLEGGAGGTGLGLPSVRMIAAAHGGKAWAESEPGRGSVFSLSLPRKPAPSSTTR